MLPISGLIYFTDMNDAKKNQLRWGENLSRSANREISLAAKNGVIPESPFQKTEDGLKDFRGFLSRFSFRGWK